MASAINWFEIPATNFDRAVDFYGKVLDADLQKMGGPFDMAFFPCSDGGTGGCVTHGNGNKPSAEGAFVYLNGGDDLAVPLARVEQAGGTGHENGYWGKRFYGCLDTRQSVGFSLHVFKQIR